MTIIEMQQERTKLIAEARKLLDLAQEEKRDLSAEEEARYNKVFEDAGKLKDKIEREKALAEEERRLGNVEPEPYKTQPAKKEDSEERKKELVNAGFRSYLLGNMPNQEFRAIQADSDASGGYMVSPEQFVAELITGLDNQVFVNSLANVIQVKAGTDTLGVPYLSADVADPAWTTEVASVSEDSTMAFGKRSLTPHQLTKLVKVSMKLLRVSAISPEKVVRDRFAYKFGTVMENAYLNGDGNDQPLGVFEASNDGISTGRDVSTGNANTAFTADGLINAKYALKAQYRPGAVWIMHRDAVKMASKLKDGEGQYLWKPGIAAGDPDMLLGHKLYESEYAPNTFTNGLYVGILGNFSVGYWIAMMMNFELQRLNELYAANSQVGFIGRMWADGMPVDENAFARVTLA